jgi:hypothetical protein
MPEQVVTGVNSTRSFRRAWDSALVFAVPKLKDIALERAIVPVFSGGKLMGFRRKYNDKLLMFCLRHYGQDASGRRTTINYFSTRASAGAADPSAGPAQGRGGGRGFDDDGPHGDHGRRFGMTGMTKGMTKGAAP